MGAEYSEVRFKGELTKEELKKEYREYIESLYYEYGYSGYSGTLKECSGLKITNQTFDSASEAEEWLWDNTCKWENAKAVKMIDKDKKVFWLIGGCCSS